MAMIETHKLTKTFKARKNTVEAVRGVDLEVRENEIFGFMGPNGAGKTTTMRMLSTLLDPTGGQATVCGYDLRRESEKIRKQIGYVGQKGGAEPKETGRENLVLQGRLYGMSKAEADKRASELISRLDLDTFADRLIKTYSGGQRRRLDIAMGMMHRPRLLILDEPTTGLDPQSRARIWDEVRRLRAEGMTIFLTTHYMDEADSLCDRLAIIDNGKIVGEDTPNALKQQIAGDIITLGLNMQNGTGAKVKETLGAQPFLRELQETDNGLQLYVERGEEVLPDVLRLLDHNGTRIRTVTLARPTLEDVFLRLTGRSLREEQSA
ncbi:MAG TPA: ATP-binding cassette domain-containing protein [Ktedonobacterales bacterium]|nr:ATP-binding cassette domain-containing protein [Ktedonobacterales bacterium]